MTTEPAQPSERMDCITAAAHLLAGEPAAGAVKLALAEAHGGARVPTYK